VKRSRMVEQIYDLLNCDGVLEYSMPKLEPVPLTEEHVRWIAEQIVKEFEQVKTIKIYGWEPEDE
jgi:hypothetical protein